MRLELDGIEAYHVYFHQRDHFVGDYFGEKYGSSMLRLVSRLLPVNGDNVTR